MSTYSSIDDRCSGLAWFGLMADLMRQLINTNEGKTLMISPHGPSTRGNQKSYSAHLVTVCPEFLPPVTLQMSSHYAHVTNKSSQAKKLACDIEADHLIALSHTSH